MTVPLGSVVLSFSSTLGTKPAARTAGPASARCHPLTSGTHSPMLDVGIGMGYVPAASAAANPERVIDVRVRPRRARVVKKPIYRKET